MIFCENYLVNKITNDMKDEVIRRYLQGESRNDIARTCGLGEGTVSNIEDEWKHSLGISDRQEEKTITAELKEYSNRKAELGNFRYKRHLT
jgi:transposase-like protein